MKEEIVGILNIILKYNFNNKFMVYDIICDDILISVYDTIVSISTLKTLKYQDYEYDVELIIFEIGKYCPTIQQYLRDQKLKELLK